MTSPTHDQPNPCTAQPMTSPTQAHTPTHAQPDPCPSRIQSGLACMLTVWPRGFVGAAAFWNYNSTANPASSSFVSAIWRLNDQLRARGSFTCPTNCSCDQLTACGKPYFTPPPPAAGATATTAACDSPASDRQRFQLMRYRHSSHRLSDLASDLAPSPFDIVLAANSSLCLRPPPSCGPHLDNCYPLTLEPCSSRSAPGFIHDPATSELRIDSTQRICMDMGSSVGLYRCGSGDGYLQPNQRWSVDQTTGLVVLTTAPGPGSTEHVGECLSVA